MPTKREREYYRMGFRDAAKLGFDAPRDESMYEQLRTAETYDPIFGKATLRGEIRRKPKRKLSAWNKFVKANSKKPRFVLRSGKLNLKKMGVAFRKKKRR